MIGSLLLAASLAATLTVEVADHQVWVRGVTPGAKVALYGAGWGQGTVTPFRFDDYRYGQDEDSDGVVRIFPPTGHGYDTTVSHSVWVAVDMTSGAWGEAALTLVQLGKPTWTAFSLQRTDFVFGPQGATAVAFACSGSPGGATWNVALIRPGVGLWHGSFPNSSPTGVLVSPGDLIAFPPDLPPSSVFAPGDVLVGINPDASCHAVVTLTPDLVVLARMRSRLPRL